jgi:UDP-N-acetylglucosamine--N-acetylmuramyl-(pentapeptide) pyrophosphoryl-undecaprenol N-acetylglucosamine transferase
MNTRPPRVILAGGGTGGHLYPGLALAAALQSARPDAGISFVGTREGLDRELVPRTGYGLFPLSAGRGSPLSLRRPLNAFRFLASLGECWGHFAAEKPDVAIGLGGFAAAPAGLVARWRRIPLVLLEQNVLPGRVTRLLTPRARLVCLQFDRAREHLPRTRAEVAETGSPVRPEIAALTGLAPASGARLLVIGGSQGAQCLNQIVCEALPSLIKAGVPVTHLAGTRNFEHVRGAYAGVDPAEAAVLPYCDRMAELYRDTRLAVARAGATTLAELAAAGIPAILVPYPAARDDHQTANARLHREAGAAEVEPEGALTPERLTEAVSRLWYDAQRLETMGSRMRAFARPDAADAIAGRVLQMV